MECNRIDSAGAAGDLDDELLVVVLNLLSFPSISSKRDPLPNIWYQIPVPPYRRRHRSTPPPPAPTTAAFNHHKPPPSTIQHQIHLQQHALALDIAKALEKIQSTLEGHTASFIELTDWK